jgi:hypothetical protein
MSSAPERRSRRVQGAKVLNPEIAKVILDAHLENITIVRVIDLVNLLQQHHLTISGKSFISQ